MEEKEKNLLLVIDPQYDFCNTKGTLYVPGAERATKELCKWMAQERKNISHIIVTQDTHRSYHIGHSMYWEQTPESYTEITSGDVRSGKYTPVNSEKTEEVIKYLEALEKRGLKHTIWPEHCIAGSWGWSLPKNLVEELNLWSLSNHGAEYELYQKGWDPDKEMFSAFSYASGANKTEGEEFICRIIKEDYNKIYIAGFAKDYCVAESIKDMVKYEQLKGKLVFLDKCMATIDKKNESLGVYEDAVRDFGATIIK
jgi:nicotinamidase-related amidase